MRGSLRSSLMALCASALAACAPGKSSVTVAVGVDGAIAGITQLEVTATQAGTPPRSVGPIKVAGAAPTTFSLMFDASVDGTVHLVVDGADASGELVASGSTDVAVKPSSHSDAMVTLRSGAGGPIQRISFVSGSGLAVGPPPEAMAGDIVLVLASNCNSFDPPPMMGWTQLGTVGTPGGCTSALLMRTAAAGEATNSAAYQFTSDGAPGWVRALYRGASKLQTVAAASQTNPYMIAPATVPANSVVVPIVSGHQSTCATPAGGVNLQSANGWVIVDLPQLAAGTSAGATWTCTIAQRELQQGEFFELVLAP